MRVLVAEDDKAVGDSLEAALRSAFHMVRRAATVEAALREIDTVDVALLDVQLADGTAWDVLDAIPAAHPPLKIVLASAVETVPPERWAYLPVHLKPLDRTQLLGAIDDARLLVVGRLEHNVAAAPSSPARLVERWFLADEPALGKSIPVALAAIAVTTFLMWLLKEEAFAAISAFYTAVVLVIAAWAGVTVGIGAAVVAFLAYNFFTVRPYYTFRIATAELVVDLVAFLLSAAIGALLVGLGRRHARQQSRTSAENRLRYRLLLEAATQPALSVVPVAVRVITDALPGYTVEYLRPGEPPPWWAQAAGADDVRTARRSRSRVVDGRAVLLLPVANRDGLVGILCAQAGGPHLGDTERGLLSLAAGELARLSERAGLLEAAAANDRLRATDEAKNALLAAVSHDLRTPLAAMKVAVTTLLEPSIELDPTNEQDMLATVDGEIDRLNEMIGHLLDLSRLESGAFRLDRQDVSIQDLVRDAADRIRLSYGRDVEVTTTPGLHVLGDRVRLLEAITNVLDNAARYSPAGTAVVVAATGADGGVRIGVRDTGPGMTVEEQEGLFRPFVRGTRQASGTGLGLAITRSIVHAHGGSITVKSADVGTEIVLMLPAGEAPAVANGHAVDA